MEHSKLPPSSAARRVVCPGSRALEARYPQSESSTSREGTAAHYVASEMLRSGIHNSISEIAPNGEPITQEMIEGAELYVSYISSFNLKETHIEERVNIFNIHPDCFGTPDAWGVTSDNQLHIFDYKYGHGFIDAYENWQMIEYAAGIYNQLRTTITSIYVHIIQPRNYHRDGPIRKWEITDIEKYITILRHAENLASHEDAPCWPSDQCGYCKGRHACQTLQQSSLNITDISKLNTPVDLSAEELGNELRYLKHAEMLLNARITGLEEEAKNKLFWGEKVPFFRLESTQPREQWDIDISEIIALGELFGCDVLKPQEVLTPRQVSKLGVPKEIINSYSKRPKGSVKLITDDAKRVFNK